MSSPLRVIREAMHLWSSHAYSQRMPVGTPDSSVQACSTWAKARVFPSLIAQKSLGLEASVGDRKSARWSLLNLDGAPHHPKASLLGQGQPECHSLPSGLIGGLQHCWGPPLSGGCPLTTFHWVLAPSTSWGWPIFSISMHGSTYGGGWWDLVPLALIGVGTGIDWADGHGQGL